jgi:gliding motility-associated-like protein
MCVNRFNNHIYVCDPYSHLVRKVAPLVLTLVTAGGNSYCLGNAINVQVGPSGLTGYKLYVNGSLAGSSLNGAFTVNSLPVGPHVFTATAVTGNGTTVFSDPINISITPGLNVSINVSGNSTICDGDSITLSSSIAGSYQWSNGATTPSITVTNSGSYILTVTNNQGCSGTSPAQQISTLQPPAASISSISAAPNCPGDTVVLTAGSAPQYLWSNGDTTQSIEVTGAGNYSVVVTNAAGCSAMSLPMTVNFHPVSYSSINPSGNIVIPQGSQTTLTAGNGMSYQWSNGAITQSIQVSNAGSYTVTVTNTNGCVAVPASVNVSYLSTSNMVSVSGVTSFCKGDSVLLSSAFNSNNQWYRNGSPISGANGSTYSAKVSGTYQLRYTPPSSTPVFSSDILVEVQELPNVLNTVSSGVCPLSAATIEITPVNGISYVWFDAPVNGSIVGAGETFVTPVLQSTTSFYVQQTNSFGCVSESPIEVVAEVFDAPSSDFYSSEAATDPSGYRVSFEANDLSATNYLWDFGDPGSTTNTSTLPSPEHIYANTGVFQVVCVAISSEGCADTTIKDVRVALPDHIFIPNTFTPDGDGQNDVFRVRGNNILYSDIQVFDQWGQNICSLSKTTTGWNGESPRGLLPSGTYNYAVKVYLDNGVTSYHRGSINLIR